MDGWQYAGNGIRVVKHDGYIIIRHNNYITMLDAETGEKYDFLTYLKTKRKELEQTRKELLKDYEKIKSSREEAKKEV